MLRDLRIMCIGGARGVDTALDAWCIFGAVATMLASCAEMMSHRWRSCGCLLIYISNKLLFAFLYC